MPRILITDDSSYQRALLRNLLEPYGEISEAAGGKEACRLFAQALDRGRPFDLALMDILMPGMDGHSALRLFIDIQDQAGIAAEDRVKVIMVSSMDDPANMMQAQYGEGAAAYVTKPYDQALLVEVLRGLDVIDNPLDMEVGEVGEDGEGGEDRGA